MICQKPQCLTLVSSQLPRTQGKVRSRLRLAKLLYVSMQQYPVEAPGFGRRWDVGLRLEGVDGLQQDAP
jgi:hypothetical protein